MTEYRNPRPGRLDSHSIRTAPQSHLDTTHHHLTPPETIQRPCHGLRRRPDHKGQEGPAGAEVDQVSRVRQRQQAGEKSKPLHRYTPYLYIETDRFIAHPS